MRFQKVLLYFFLATLAVGCDRYGGFDGCWGCEGFNGCEQWELADDHFTRHESSLPFGAYFSFRGFGNLNPEGPSVNGTLNPDAFAHFGIQHFFSNNIAGRLFLTFNRLSDGADSNERVNSEFGLGAGILYYPKPLYNIAPYFGGGLGYAASSRPGFSQFPDGNQPGQNPQGGSGEPGVFSRSSFGVTAVAGFDWYLTPNIAIGSEYAFGFSAISQKFKGDISDQESDRGTATSLGFTPAGNLHILVHF